jgi:hypothetical protein
MESEETLAPRRMSRGPKGRWKVVPAATSDEERRLQQDRIALANHLTGFVAPRMTFS